MTIKDIAKLAHVSTATVSRVINSPDKVSADKKALVDKIIQESNYFPNALARGLIQAKTKSIGVIIPDINNLFYPAVVRGLEDSLESNGYNLFLCNTDKYIEKEIKYINTLLEQRVDGIVFMGTRPIDPHKNAHIKAVSKRIPVIMVNDYIVGSEAYSVLSDEIDGAYNAVKYLIELGHTRIAFFTGESEYTTYRNKEKGYEMALSENKIPILEEYIYRDGASEEGGARNAKRMLEKGNPMPTAIFAASDQTALGAIKAISEAKFKVPEDFSIIGYANIPISSLLYPELTTINQFPYETGKMAAELLAKIIDGEKPNQRKFLIEPKLIVRQSCMRLAP